MQSAALAYGNTAKQTSSPRELEADLLLKAAARLQAVRDAWDKDLVADALLYNRKLWTVFMSTAVDGTNPLPAAIRQNVANLGIFVMGQTMETISDPKPERLNPLININRELAAGLMGRAA